METTDDSVIEVVERTMPEEIADLDLEVQAMYDRIRTRLGLQPTQREKIGRYELEDEKLGVGGMGSVYRAYDTQLRRPVAIKVVSPRSLTKVNKLRERLRREAIVLAKLEHPNIVTLFDGGVDDGRVFLAMELVEGETLRARQIRPDCSPRERVRLYADAGRGLAAAHRQGVVHRDFKPDNVFVGADGRARVGDFGLAYVLGEHEIDIDDEQDPADQPAPMQRMTQTGEFLGTLGYSAPEQLRGQRPDARSDQYAFCVALWESLSGEKPYVGETREQMLDAMEGSEPRGTGELPRRLRRALRVGLSSQPHERYPHMDAVVHVLERELQRPDRVRGRVVLGSAAAVGLAGMFALWLANETTSPPCPLAEQFAAQPSTAVWASFADAWPSVADRFEDHLETLEADARVVCLTEGRDRARTQQLHALARSLERLPSYAPDRFDEFAHEFESALVAGPTKPLTPAVEAFMADEIEPLEAQEPDPFDSDPTFEAIISTSTKGLKELAETPVDRAEFRLRRGRAYLLHADHDFAVDDFEAARDLAELAHDDERRLQADIEAAKTLIMRRENLDAGAVWLGSAQALLASVDELALSPRRVALDELEATLARREGKFDEALSFQRRAVLRDVLAGRVFDLVPRLITLGNIRRSSGQPRAAEAWYRAALQIDANDPEAQLNLGQLLVNESDKLDEARGLLDPLLASGHRDTHLPAAVSMLQLEVQLEDFGAIARRRVALLELLEEKHPGTSTHALEGWYWVVLAYAVEGELGSGFDAALDELLPVLSAEHRTQLGLDLNLLIGPERARLALERSPSP